MSTARKKTEKEAVTNIYDQTNIYINRMSEFKRYPKGYFQWFAQLDDECNPMFISLFAFNQFYEPEQQFIWLTDYESIEYWLEYLYHFDHIRPHILKAVYNPCMPQMLYLSCLNKLHDLQKLKVA
jgi:hypothetical protein